MDRPCVTDTEILAALDLVAAMQTMAYDEDVAAGLSKSQMRSRQAHFLRVRARIADFMASPDTRATRRAAR